MGFSHITGWKTCIVWSESADTVTCLSAQTGWFVLAWDEVTLILSLLRVSWET